MTNVSNFPVVIDSTARIIDDGTQNMLAGNALITPRPSVTPGASRTLTQASRQWASRPSDERFVSLTELDAHCQNVRTNSRARVVPNRALRAEPTPDNSGLVVVGPNGSPVSPTHWAFGQLAQRADAPAGYLRDLPSPLAADCINYGLMRRDVEEMGVLLNKGSDSYQLTAVTGPNYGRVWNSTITRALVDRFGDGITGDFRVPGEFGRAVTVTKENTTLFASDRDMFVFLADEKNRIEIPDRRDGQPGTLARGFFVWNSEVGAGTLGIATFLFDYVCCNRMVWGARQYGEIRVRHTAGAPMRWLEDVTPAIERYANSSTHSITHAIEQARLAKIGNGSDDVREFLAKRFNRSQAGAMMAAHMSDEGRPIETLWDATVGATAYARGLQYQDARVDIEREAGKILDLASE
jgi:hypothetical protein